VIPISMVPKNSCAEFADMTQVGIIKYKLIERFRLKSFCLLYQYEFNVLEVKLLVLNIRNILFYYYIRQ